LKANWLQRITHAVRFICHDNTRQESSNSYSGENFARDASLAEARAAAQGRTLSNFVATAAEAAARKVIEQAESRDDHT
jgi:Protein of unknown function (DUF1778)